MVPVFLQLIIVTMEFLVPKLNEAIPPFASVYEY
jgi:hypothetical protein